MSAPMTFPTADTTPARWLVLRCAPALTINLASELAYLGAWTPVRTEKRRVGRTNDFRPARVAQMPSFIFVMEDMDLPDHTRVSFNKMRRPDGSPIKVRNAELDHLRKIADKPIVAARDLPRVGATVRLPDGAFGGLWGKVLESTVRYVTVAVDGFAVSVKIDPCLLPQDVQCEGSIGVVLG